MIGIEDARAIVYHLDAGRLARLAFRAAAASGESGRYRAVAVVLDLETGAVRHVCWRAGEEGCIWWPEHLIVLGYADTGDTEDAMLSMAMCCEVPPSIDVIEEHVAGAAA